MNLVLTCKEGESVLIDDDIQVTVVWSSSGSVKLSFDAPQETSIVRTEILERDMLLQGAMEED
tara:strand:- start:258 stop:446 length:189 start_codon:yes stop_codon:yes gene_type:complete